MAKKAGSDLFELIHSMSKAEKQTVCLVAGYYSRGSKKYMHLFRLMEKQRKFDEEKIKNLLRREKIKTPLAQLKAYLLDLVLKSLRFHHSEKTTDGQLRNLVADSEICHRKGLNVLRDKMLRKAKHLSVHHEKYEASLLVLEREWDYSSPGSMRILEEEASAWKKISAKNEFRQLFLKTRQLMREGEIREEHLNAEWNHLILNSEMNRTIVPAGFEESYNYYRIWRLYYERMNDLANCDSCQDLIISKLESRPQWIRENPEKYMSQLNNQIVSSGKIRNMGKAAEAMNKLAGMQDWDLNRLEKHKLNNYIILGYSNILFGLIHAAKFDELGTAIAPASEFVMANDADSQYRSTLYNALSAANFLRGDHSRALFWNNLFLNEPHKYHRDSEAVGKIFNLVLHYELGHDDLLPYITRAAYRSLYKSKRLYKMEDTILGFIRNKMPKANSTAELTGFFKELKAELTELAKDPFEANVFEDFDFIAWLESKIENRPMTEILLRRNKP